MAGTIVGIPSSRISDVFVREQLLNQIQISQSSLFKIQTQLSSGHRFETLSEDPVAALQVISLQSLLERKSQIKTNIQTNQSYMNVTDSALSGVSDLLAEMRGTALSMIGVTATDIQRKAAAIQVGQVVQQLVDTGNRKFNGRYLFSGSVSAAAPFKYAGNTVQYFGNEQKMSSYADLNLLFDTNLNGNQVFGAISSQVKGGVKTTPTLTYDTRLADLRQGQGISKGSILVSDGSNTSTIDLSGAETIGDLAAIIHAHPPAGRELNVDITADRIIIQLDKLHGGDLSIREVGGGTLADELGIRRNNGVGNNPIAGRALEPILRGTTSLQNILGAYANTTLHSSGRDNDIILRADTMGATTGTGAALNDVTVSLVDDPMVNYGNEWVEYHADTRILTVHIDNGFSRANHVINAINKAHDNGDIPFTAAIDPTDDVNGGQNLVDAGATALTRDGAGELFDSQSGLKITNGGREINVNLSTAKTVEDVLNAINVDTGLLAQINDTKDGIDIRSRDSGADFMIGENGGKTAAQLGLRTLTEATPLDDLNYGRGVGKTPDPAATDGSEITVVRFNVVRSDGVQLNIDITKPQTIGDVINAINDNPNNADGKLVARLNVYGNGIELVDTSAGAGELTVIPDSSNRAALDLGLVPEKGTSSAPSTVNYAAKLISAPPNSQIIFTAKDTSVDLTGTQIIFDHLAQGVTYDEVGHTLTIGIVPGTTTAANVVEAVNQSSASSVFHAALDPTGGNPNDGSGMVDEISQPMTAAKVIDGQDKNKKETEGVFTALLRLQQALQDNDTAGIQRAVELLDNGRQNLNFSRAELGTRQQGLSVMSDRLDTENIELKKVLSDQFDADLAQVVSDLAGRQAAFEASLRATASILQMSLLDYL